MRLTVDFTALWRAVDTMGANKTTIDLDQIWSDTEVAFDKELSSSGVEINLDDLESSQGLLSVKGRQVILFIPDQGFSVDSVISDPSSGKKFHVAECQTLETMRQRGRFARYKVTNNLSGDFPVYGTSESTNQKREGTAKLNVCKNCLKALNYKGADTGNTALKNRIVKNFSIEEFFATYSSVFKYLPKDNIKDTKFGYSSDWGAISAGVRRTAGYICGKCNVNLTDHKRLLHVHHINGEKSDNSRANLLPLCIDCHRREPAHGHMQVKRDDMITINRLRRQQTKLVSGPWEVVVQVADPAVHGVIDYCQKQGMAAPEVGYELMINQGVFAELELAWPRKRIGISLGDAIEYKEWEILNLKQALQRFK